MARLIDADDAILQIERREKHLIGDRLISTDAVKEFIKNRPTIEAEPVRHGEWILEAHDERVNYSWIVTAKCSECGHELGEIWGGFFPAFPSDLAEDVCLNSAKSVDLHNYCPNCGARMDGE